MATIEKNRTFWQILLWWGSWHLVAFFLTNSYEYPDRFLMRAFVSFAAFTMVVYVNMKYLLPKFFFEKKKIAYFILGGVMVVILAVALLHLEIFPWSDWFNKKPNQDLSLPPQGAPMSFRWMGRISPYVIAFLGSTLVEIFRFANQKEKEVIQAEKEKLNAELKFLKSQVNPHFLFNALNNIYSLAVMQAPQTPDSVMQLSEILRYMVYDSNEEKVPLKSEINYIKNFVDLKLLKDSRGMDVQLDLDHSAQNLRIAPLLLIPLVENAFKHSKIENLKSGFIKIKLTSDQQWISFHVENSVPENKFTKDEVGGVGLENTRKRLELLYPDGQHELNINQTDDRFEVILKIVVS